MLHKIAQFHSHQVFVYILIRFPKNKFLQLIGWERQWALASFWKFSWKILWFDEIAFFFDFFCDVTNFRIFSARITFWVGLIRNYPSQRRFETAKLIEWMDFAIGTGEIVGLFIVIIAAKTADWNLDIISGHKMAPHLKIHKIWAQRLRQYKFDKYVRPLKWLNYRFENFKSIFSKFRLGNF